MGGQIEQCGMPINPRNLLFKSSLKSSATHIGCPDSRQPKFIVPLNDNNLLCSFRFFLSTAKALFYFVRFRLLSFLGGSTRSRYSESECLRGIKAQLGCDDALAILASGTPGPLNKATVLLKHLDGSIHSVVKIATSVQAINLVNKECRTLIELHQRKSLSKYVPKVISDSDSGSYAYLAMTAIKGRVPTKKLHEIQLVFLDALNVQTQKDTKFEDSDMWRVINYRYSSIEGVLSEKWTRRLKTAFAILSDGFSGETIPMSLAHRDFSPWNMRLVKGCVYVFDWEYAEEGYIPLYDIFHYLVMTKVLRRRLRPCVLLKVQSDVHHIVNKYYTIKEVYYRPDLQLLAYMIDVCLLYLEANNGCDQGDKVLSRYGEAIDNYSYWCDIS